MNEKVAQEFNTHQTNQTHQTNEINQTNQTNEINNTNEQSVQSVPKNTYEKQIKQCTSPTLTVIAKSTKHQTTWTGPWNRVIVIDIRMTPTPY